MYLKLNRASWKKIEANREIFDNVIYQLELHERPPLARTSKATRDAVTEAIWYCVDARVYKRVTECEIWQSTLREQNMVVS